MVRIPRSLTRPGGVPLLLVAAAWAVAGVADELRVFALNRMRRPDAPFDLEFALLSRVLDVATWTAFTPLIFALSRRFTVRAGDVARPLLVHVGAGLALALASAYVNSAYAASAGKAVSVLGHTAAIFHLNFFSYAVAAGLSHLVLHARAAREREAGEAELEGRLAVAQLQALKTQVEPHFLFNTLNSVAQLIHENPAAAERMLARLERLLRLTLESAAAGEVTLRRELRMLRSYLEIQRTRFEDRLRFDLRVEPGTAGALVPTLILQPLVENSIRHGLAPRAAPGHVRVAAGRERGVLRLEVRDDGVGLGAASAGGREGVGLRNTRARLERLYGSEHRFEVRPAEGGGVVATVEIPFRRAPEGGDPPRDGEAR